MPIVSNIISSKPEFLKNNFTFESNEYRNQNTHNKILLKGNERDN